MADAIMPQERAGTHGRLWGASAPLLEFPGLMSSAAARSDCNGRVGDVAKPCSLKKRWRVGVRRAGSWVEMRQLPSRAPQNYQ